MTDRKQDHIKLALQSQLESIALDTRFYYEPLLHAHPVSLRKDFAFLGKNMQAPLWISSMTGGIEKAGEINRRLARVCKEFGLGMGLGSCRKILDSKKSWSDFDLRDEIGDQPFYANLGIAQTEELLFNGNTDKISELISDLRADGLVIHVNPLQEWFQPEGDRLSQPPLKTITELLQKVDFPIIVKEVGQGMGPDSLRNLLELPLEAIEFAAFGGTNFSKIEMIRSDIGEHSQEPLVYVGHSAAEMVEFVNRIVSEKKSIACKQVIISGGLRNFLDGYYLMGTCKLPSIYGHGANLLKYASKGYQELHDYVEGQILGLRLAEAYLKVRESG